MSAEVEQEPSVVRLYAGADQQSHFEDVQLTFRALGDRSEMAELIEGSGILVRRFETGRANPWHHAPGRYAVFTLCEAVDITVGAAGSAMSAVLEKTTARPEPRIVTEL